MSDELKQAITKLSRAVCMQCSTTVHTPGCPVGVVVRELERVRESRERLRIALQDSIDNDDAVCNDLVRELPDADLKPFEEP